MDWTHHSPKENMKSHEGEESSDDEDERVVNSILLRRHVQAVAKIPIVIVLDGDTAVGKSMFLNRLINGNFNYNMPTTLRYDGNRHEMIIKGVKFKTLIWESNISDDFRGNLWPPHTCADVIIEFFAIDCPGTEVYAIDKRIPHLLRNFPRTPILLVGAKADLRDTASDQSNLISPSELGPLLSKRVGAVGYFECSSKTNFNVHKIFEEAVRVAIAKKYVSIVHEDFYTKIQEKAPGIESERAAISKAYFYDRSIVEKQLIKMTSDTMKISRKDVQMFHVLELERIELSYGLAGTHYIVRESLPPSCSLWNVTGGPENQIINCRLFSISERCENMICEQSPVNLRFFEANCESIVNFLTTINPLIIRSLVIVNCFGVLNFSFLDQVTGLEYLVIVNTEVNIESLTFPPQLHDTLKHLVMQNCEITQATDVPRMIGKLKNLQILNVAKNNFKKLPFTLHSLQQLHTLLIDVENVVFPPFEVLKKSAKDVVRYLEAIQEDPVENNETKLIVVGQEGVGKSTLIKAMKKDRWFRKNKPADKTDGVDISVLALKGMQCKVYDLAGDVEYLKTHSLFLSSNCLHLVVFNLSNLVVSKHTRSADHLCRLELWLQTIASQDPKSYVIIVGTHADHTLLSEEMLRKTRELAVNIFEPYCLAHQSSFKSEPCEDCMICKSDKIPPLKGFETLSKCHLTGKESSENSIRCVPHILGYFEVSGIMKYPSTLVGLSNRNLEELKSSIHDNVVKLMSRTGNENIPRKWLSFRENIEQALSSDDDLKEQPVFSLSQVYDTAFDLDIVRENVVAMLRFFHSQGTFLWYEDLPEIKDILIMDPQWLSDQLRTLISHKPNVRYLIDGVLKIADLANAWPNITGINRSKLLSLFRSAGLCFKISDTEELFPCDLPIGWPDENMWSSLPRDTEKQTSLLFEFSFVPPSFFPDLIVEVNKKRESFVLNVKPLYYRFHIVYIIKDEGGGTSFDVKCDKSVDGDNKCMPAMTHRVHYELMPYNNTLKISIRGPHPSSIVPEVRSVLMDLVRSRYSGITHKERLLCPECEMKNVKDPAKFDYDVDHDGFCSKGHKIGSTNDILDGKLGPKDIRLPEPGKKVILEVLEDHLCPKLFVVLPINLEGLPLINRFVYSHLRDGFAVHLLCECPDQWHFVDSPGFRIGKPKEFFKEYGSLVCKALEIISTVLSVPFKAASSVDPHCKAGAAIGIGANTLSTHLKSLLQNYLEEYPELKSTNNKDLEDLKVSSGLRRSNLSRFLKVKAENRNFGPLVCTFVNKYNDTLWLCKEHSERFNVVSL